MKGFIRPKAGVLPDDAVVPDKNLISPAPNQFTHELVRSESYYYDDPNPDRPSDGEFEKNTPVVLLKYDGGTYCYVADGQGLYVQLAYDSLKPLTNP